MANYTELFIDTGSDFGIDLTVTNDFNGAGLNLSGYNVSSQIRRSYYSRNPTANFTCNVADVSNGVVTLTLSGPASANVTPGVYVFDVKANAANSSLRLLEGIITFSPNSTR